MKRLSYLLLFSISFCFYTPKLLACDEASMIILNETLEANGDYTFQIEFCIEMLGLEGKPDWFQLEFVGSAVNSFTPMSVSTSGGETYNGTIMNGNTVRWTTTDFPIIHATETFCNIFDITMTGRPTIIRINYHDEYPLPDCYEDYVVPADPCDPDPNAPDCDQDGDGLTNDVEATIGTNPTLADTDGDGIEDGAEVTAGSSPVNPCDPDPDSPACCTADEYYTSTIAPAIYQTSNSIGSNGQVLTGTFVTFLSGYIDLEADFNVELGADFLGDIDPCSPNTP